MKGFLSIAVLLLVLPIQQSPPPPAAPRPAAARPAFQNAAECKCSIEITVKHQGSGEPLGDVAIIVTTSVPATQNTLIDGGPRPAAPAAQVTLTATTDSSGHATFSNLVEGIYSIRAERDGLFAPIVDVIPSAQVFATAAVGPVAANRVSLLNDVLTTNAAIRGGLDPASAANVIPQPVQHVSISMIQGSVISGRIQDVNHRPSSDIWVVPFQVAYQNGQRILRQAIGGVQTDDLGQFRLFWFTPGEYYLRTMQLPAQSARGGGFNFPSWTYYPGTLDPARATPIVVREGEESNGANFELQPGKGVTLSGTVTNTLPGRVNPNGLMNRTIGSYFLVPRNSGFADSPISIPNAAATVGRRGAVNPDETAFPFEIRGVPPGIYDFYPIFNDGASLRSNYTGHIAIEVGTEDITGIQSAIQPGVDMKVHLSVIGAASVTPANRPGQAMLLQNIRMAYRPADNLPDQLILRADQLTAAADTDGFMTLPNLPEARFITVQISRIPIDAYISEMRQGSHSIMNDGVFTIGKETPDPLEVVIGRSGGTISGTLQDSQLKSLTGLRVFLVPDAPRRRNLLLYKSINVLQAGTFSFSGIAPGTYKLFAWDNIPQGAEQNEEFMSRYDALGTRVAVDAGTPLTNIQVSVIQANR